MKAWVFVAACLAWSCGPKEQPRPTAVQRLAGRVAADAEKEAKESLDRMDDLDDAKAVAEAASEYALSHADAIPGPSAWKDGLGPMLKDPKVLDRFVWTYPGGVPARIDQTRLGYVGHAYAYADGHAKSEE